MPNEVIAQVHHLASMVRKYNGMVFTDINGNILSEQFNEETDNMRNASEIQHTDYVQGNTTNFQESDDMDNANDGNTITSQEIENDGSSGNEDQLPDNNELPDENINELPDDEPPSENENTEEKYDE